jgi:hypothetical protein
MTQESGISTIFLTSSEAYDYTLYDAAEQWRDIGNTKVVKLHNKGRNYQETIMPVEQAVKDRLEARDYVFLVGTGRNGLHAVAALALFPEEPVNAITVCTNFDLTNIRQGGQTPEARARRWIRETARREDISGRVLKMIDTTSSGDYAGCRFLANAIVYPINGPASESERWKSPVRRGLIDQRSIVPEKFEVVHACRKGRRL